MSDIFEPPKPKQTKIKLGDKRYYLGIEGYKTPCTIEEWTDDGRVNISIGARFYHDKKLTKIGELCD